MKLLLEKCSKINDKDYDSTALIDASDGGHIAIVKLLLEAGANVNDKDSEGETALICASRKGHIDVIKILLQVGANVNDKDNIEKTALTYALQYHHVEVIKFLLEKGADINCKNIEGKNLLNYISKKLRDEKYEKREKYLEIAYMIIRKKAEDYIQLFISLNKNDNTNQEMKDEIHNYISLLYSLQNLPVELFEEVIKNLSRCS